MQIKMKKISGDASFREFYRIQKNPGSSILVKANKDKYKNLSATSFTTYNNELVISFDGFANQEDIVEFADFVFAKIKMKYWHADKVPTFH